jgi:16S rRNA processing protein RimM
MTKYYNVGKIVNTHGIRGEIRVISSSDFASERYIPGNTLFFFKDEQSKPIPLKITGHRTHKNFDLLTFENHPNINDVEPYKGGLLKVKESDRKELDTNEYYYDQIIGCEVVTDEGQILGKIREILATGANDVWIIQRYEKGKDILIPYIEDVVKEIDVQQKKIVIHLLDGLI